MFQPLGSIALDVLEKVASGVAEAKEKRPATLIEDEAGRVIRAYKATEVCAGMEFNFGANTANPTHRGGRPCWITLKPPTGALMLSHRLL